MKIKTLLAADNGQGLFAVFGLGLVVTAAIFSVQCPGNGLAAGKGKPRGVEGQNGAAVIGLVGEEEILEGSGHLVHPQRFFDQNNFKQAVGQIYLACNDVFHTGMGASFR